MKYKLPIEQIISKLGYDSSENLYLSGSFGSAPLTQHTRRILEEIHPYAVYIVNNAPFILFFDETANDTSLFKMVNKQIWNAQIPVAIFCNEGTVRVFNGTALNVTNQMLTKVQEYSLAELSENSDFSCWQISNPTFWNKYLQKYSATKLNQVLLDNIAFITDELKSTYHIPFATKLVLRLIFVRFLIDRGVDLDYNGFSADILQSQNEFINIISDRDKVYKLFAHLKNKFNGNLFELNDELECSELTENVFKLLATFFAGDEVLSESGSQLSLFKLYDFNIIPVELISNIYEILLGKEKRNRDNAFYTPNYLVEYVLNKTIAKALKDKHELKILDPACGSGVFLVDSYRRIIQENLGEKAYYEDDAILKKLLTDNIYGVDINDEAIDVTIFSLYLTILDYKDPKTLSEFTLPNLKGENLFVSDFFSVENLAPLLDKKIEFDYIIGNPPWGRVTDGLHMEYCRKCGYAGMQQNADIGRSFVFRARDFCSENTICCFILHAKLLYSQKNPTIKFRQFLLTDTEICEIVELSSVRKLVFENARAPAIIAAFKYSSQDNLKHSFLYTSIKPNVFFRLFHIVCIERHDIKYVQQSFLFDNDWAWKTIVYGFSRDIETVMRLKNQFNTIKKALKTTKPPLVLGSGIQDHCGDAQDASALIGFPVLDSDEGVDHFYLCLDGDKKFNKPRIHRIRKKELFDPPHCLTAKGLDCKNYKMRSAYSDERLVCKETMYVIKGTSEQEDILYNLVGLFNSSLFAYLNLMLGSSVGIEREQRFMNEVLSFPYVFSHQIAEKAKVIQESKKNLFDLSSLNDVENLDKMVLDAYGLGGNQFIDYAINIQIPELVDLDGNQTYKKVCAEDLKEYSSCFVKYFSTIYGQHENHISVTLYPTVGINYAVFELHIVAGQGESEITIADQVDDEKLLLAKFAVYSHNDRFYQIRDVIHFAEDSFFIIKPNMYRNWHPAIAELDLADAIEDIMSASGGGE